MERLVLGNEVAISGERNGSMRTTTKTSNEERRAHGERCTWVGEGWHAVVGGEGAKSYFFADRQGAPMNRAW